MANIFHRNMVRQELTRYVGHTDQVAGIKLLEAADGVERGNRVLEVWTGSGLFFHVLADRALDISTCQFKGIPLAWKSATGDSHPAYYDPHGLAWLRTFQGGMLVTCGLDTFGPPSRDGEEDLGLHGRVSNTPAKAVCYQTSWHGDEYQLEIWGEVRQTRVFGENLVLRRRLLTWMGSNRIRIEDRVTNEGFSPHPHMILYHVNAGYPLLSEDARLKLEVEGTTPRDPESAGGLKDWSVFQPPTPDFKEQNFIHAPVADEKGWVKAELENPGLGLTLRLSFDKSTLPFMNEWKMTGEGLYVLGIEPMNCRDLFEGQAEARRRESLPTLKAGESVEYALEIEVIENQ